MPRRIITAILFAFLMFVYFPGLLKGQSLDSLLYLIDNDLLKDDSEKYDLICEAIEDIYDPERKIYYSDLAIELAQKLDILPAQPYLKKGEGYLDSGKLVLALECFIQAASYYKKSDSSGDLGNAYLLIAETYNKQGNSDNEKLYLQNAIDIFEQDRDTFRLAFALHNLGYFNYSIGQHDTAIVVYTKSLDLIQKIDHPYANYAYFVWLGNLGLVYSRLLDYAKAEEYILTAIDTLSSFGDERSVTEFMIEYAHILQQKGEIRKAITTASGAFNKANDPEYQRDASRLLTELYQFSGNPDSALYYQSIFIAANDSIENIESVREMADLRTEFEVGQKQAEVDVLEKDKLIKNIVLIGLGIILLLAIGLITLYYTSLKRSRKLGAALEERRVLLENQSSELKVKNDEILSVNEELTQLNEEINAQKEEIESQRDHLFVQNEAICSSINYAQRIQSAMLPPESYIQELLDEVFILFRPRDVVSGDFYWIKQVNQYIVLVAADCTGHGVPGALMSMLGISQLNEIVHRQEITQANQVLDELRKRIKFALRQHGQPDEAKDGIDMALCVLDSRNMTMQFSGANNPMYLIRSVEGEPQMEVIKADRMPIGFYPGKDQSFTNHDITLESGDTFYLFSDGFADQKGGSENKKFLSKNFRKLLLEIHEEPMQEQKDILKKTLNNWMGNTSQIDDIMVMGIRV